MGEGPNHVKAERTSDLIRTMGQEQRALLARRTAIMLLQVCACVSCSLPRPAFPVTSRLPSGLQSCWRWPPGSSSQPSRTGKLDVNVY